MLKQTHPHVDLISRKKLPAFNFPHKLNLLKIDFSDRWTDDSISGCLIKLHGVFLSSLFGNFHKKKKHIVTLKKRLQVIEFSDTF